MPLFGRVAERNIGSGRCSPGQDSYRWARTLGMPRRRPACGHAHSPAQSVAGAPGFGQFFAVTQEGRGPESPSDRGFGCPCSCVAGADHPARSTKVPWSRTRGLTSTPRSHRPGGPGRGELWPPNTVTSVRRRDDGPLIVGSGWGSRGPPTEYGDRIELAERNQRRKGQFTAASTAAWIRDEADKGTHGVTG